MFTVLVLISDIEKNISEIIICHGSERTSLLVTKRNDNAVVVIRTESVATTDTAQITVTGFPSACSTSDNAEPRDQEK